MTTKKRFDIFDIRSTSDEAKVTFKVGEMECSVVEYQAIVGRLYVKAARFRNVTKKHAAWRKAADIRDKVNKAYMETIHADNISSS